MNSFNATAPVYGLFVKPQGFYINGFVNMPYIRYYFIFLSLVYVISVLGNSFIIFIISMERSLHIPKYVALFNLAVVDTCTSTAVIPKMIEIFLFDSRFITYEACLANMFFVHFCTTMQSLTLVILAYDRFVAICFPLNYHINITNNRMIVIITTVWSVAVTIILITVVLITRLSFCKSTVIESYFCDHGPVYNLACNDKYPNLVMAFFNITTVLLVPLVLIILSYICILFALLKIASLEGRWKAFNTCTSHLMLVAVFYLPILGIYFATITSTINPNIRILSTSLSRSIPSLMNPIIHAFKTEEIKESCKKIFKRNRI
ncbi:olfactory receptor 51E2-like [Lepisosteus oculatus]|uniref:olfactory receptor 51E2-like n=1 Tax=Lepisosteus oculatus TaxID=7918 RepID=UPI0037212E83